MLSNDCRPTPRDTTTDTHVTQFAANIVCGQLAAALHAQQQMQTGQHHGGAIIDAITQLMMQ